MTWRYPRYVAHRGGGTLAPENTLGAMRMGASKGFKGVEFDVMLTRDDTAILLHDETLDRTTNGHGHISEYGDSHLWALDAGIRHHHAFAGEPIPRFAQIIERCRALDLAANVEIKPVAGRERITGRYVARLAAEGWGELHPPPLLSSFSEEALRAAAEMAPELPRGWLTDTIPEDWKTRVHALGVIAVHTNCKHLTEAQAKTIKDFGLRLVVYTENDPGHARLLRQWGVDTIITDRPDLVRA